MKENPNKKETPAKKTPFVSLRVMPICPRCENTWNGFVCHKCNYKPNDEDPTFGLSPERFFNE